MRLRSRRRRRSALDCRAELESRIEVYRQNRSVLLARLPNAGLGRFAPVDGAFYLYVDVSELTADSATLCEELLQATGVALASGADFDSVCGQRFVRLAFAGRHEQVLSGTERLAAWLSRHRAQRRP